MDKKYLSLLTDITKKHKNDFLGKYYAKDGKIMATDLSTMVEVDFEGVEGAYTDFELQKAILGTYTPSGDLEDMPELNETNWSDWKVLPVDKIIEALDYVSKDQARPVLTYVYMCKDYVSATDGYHLYYSEHKMTEFTTPNGEKFATPVLLSPYLVKAIKKFKKDNWVLRVGKSHIQVSNGFVVITERKPDYQFPDIPNLLSKNDRYDTRITLPKGIYDFKKVEAVRIELGGGELALRSGKIFIDGQPSGLEARVETYIYRPSSTRRVVMPLSGNTSSVINFNLSLLGKKTTLFFNSENPTSFCDVE